MMKKISVHVGIVLMAGMLVLFGAAWAAADDDDSIKEMLAKSGVSVGGFVDTSYSTNLNEPTDRNSNFRVYDTEADSFQLNTTHLFIGKEATAEGGAMNRAGFYFSLDIGDNADVNAPAGTDGADQVDFQEAYVNYLFPIGSGLMLTAGKFATLAGAELMNSKDNMNFSSSYAFAFGPFTHTGVRLSYDVNSMVGVTLGALNGWDNVDDNNDSKTLEAGLSLNPFESLSWNHAVYYGSEQDEVVSLQRFFYDTVLTYTPSSRFKFVTQFDYGKEQQDGAKGAALAARATTGLADNMFDSVQQSAAFVPGNGGEWNSVVGYANYTPTDKLGFTVRGERFDDTEGARTGIDQVLYGLTFTTQYNLTPDLMTRLEYRYDVSSQDVFGTDSATDPLDNNQSTIGAQIIYMF